MAVSRKERKAQARRAEATLAQAERVSHNLRRDNNRLRRQVDSVNAQLQRSVDLPHGLLEDLLRKAMSQTIREMTREMRNTVRDIVGFTNAVGDELLAHMIIRTSEHPTASMVEDVQRGDKHITFDFPGFRWTHVVDRHMLENLKGGRTGPAIMRDEPIYHMDDAPTRMVLDTPDVRSYRGDVPVKVI